MPSFLQVLTAGEAVDIGEAGVTSISCRNNNTTATIVIAFDDGTQRTAQLNGGDYGEHMFPPPIVNRITNRGPDDVEVSFNVPDDAEPMEVE